MHTCKLLTPRQLHDERLDSEGLCPDGGAAAGCVYCQADKQAEQREHGDYSADVWPEAKGKLS